MNIKCNRYVKSIFYLSLGIQRQFMNMSFFSIRLFKKIPFWKMKLFNCRWTLADAITNVLEEYPEDKQSWRKSLLKACIRWLVANYSSCKVEEEKMKETELALLGRLQELLVSFCLLPHLGATQWSVMFIFNILKPLMPDYVLFLQVSVDEVNADDWNKYIKNGLK